MTETSRNMTSTFKSKERKMRKITIAATLSIVLLGGAGTGVFAAHGKEPAVEGKAGMEGMTNMDGMAGMEGMPAEGGAMPMQGMGMMPIMMGMMEMMPMMGMMPMGGQPTSAMAGMADTAPAPQAVPPGLEQKLDLLITSIDSLTARIEALEAPPAN